MISISATTADPAGTVILYKHVSSNLKTNTSRVTRTATLDGGVVINHLGIVDGDRTLQITADITKTIADNIWYIYQNYPYIFIAIEEGVFFGAIKTLTIQNGQVVFSVLINNKESE